MFLNRLTGMVSGILLTALSSFAVNYYVAPAPAGNDNAAGTLAAPFATITKARDVVKALGTLTEDANVYLRGGWYLITSPVTFDASNSGSGGKNIVYQAMPGEYPVISGGKRVTGWTLHDANKNIWKAKGVGFYTRQLYVNCVRGIRATQSASELGVRGTPTQTGYTFSGTNSMVNWGNKSDIEFVYTGGQDDGGVLWTEDRVLVQNITSDGSNTTFTMQKPGFTRVCLVDNNGPKQRATSVENAYELVNMPGEWYLDRTKDTVYYIPRQGDNMATATVIAPVIEQIIAGTGTLGSPIHNIQFKGITFAHATWMYPNTGGNGYYETQANYSISGQQPRIPGNVQFQYAQLIKFERCTFKHLGAVGLDLYNGAQKDTLIGCVFTDISANCIQLGNINDATRSDTRLRDTSNAILNTYIHDSPCEYKGGIAIMAGLTANTKISHCQIINTPYSGISSGWGWSASGTGTYMKNNDFTYNHIGYSMQVLGDGGCIYTLQKQSNEWAYNYLHHSTSGVSPDEGSSYVRVHHNVISNVDHWFHTINGHDVTFDNNYTSTANTLTWSGGTGFVITNHTVVTDGNWPQAARDIMAGAGMESAYSDVLTMPCGCSVHAYTATEKPAIVDAWALGTTQVKILFSKGVDAATATMASNYQISNGPTVSSAALSADGNTVTLIVSALSDATLYTLTINNVKDREVTPNTITANTTKQFGTLRYGLKVWLKFDEASGATAADASGSGNNSTVAGTTSWGSGKVDGALAFNGTNTKVTVPAAVLGSATSGNYTAAMWVNYTQIAGGIWEELFNTPTNSFNIRIAGQNFTGYLGSGGSIPNGGRSGSPVSNHADWILKDGAWTHLAVVKNGSTGNVYANGKLVVIGSAGALTSQTWSIGGNPASGNGLFKGAIDDVRFYNRALTDGEIAQLAVGNVDNIPTPVVNKTPLRRAVMVPSSIEIYTVNGKLIKSLIPKDYSSIVRINNLPRGVYVMKSMYGTQQVVRKMVSVKDVGVIKIGE